MSDLDSAFLRSPAGRVARLLSAREGPEGTWRPEELGAIYRHQLAAPIHFDLGGLDPALAPKLKNLSSAQGLLLRSFHDLFFHPCPPEELLVLTKEFAKAHQAHAESPLPREIATVVYYASIVAALVRLDRRITTLDDTTLRQGIEWTLAQPWVDDRTKELFRAGLQKLAGPPSLPGRAA